MGRQRSPCTRNFACVSLKRAWAKNLALIMAPEALAVRRPWTTHPSSPSCQLSVRCTYDVRVYPKSTLRRLAGGRGIPSELVRRAGRICREQLGAGADGAERGYVEVAVHVLVLSPPETYPEPEIATPVAGWLAASQPLSLPFSRGRGGPDQNARLSAATSFIFCEWLLLAGHSQAGDPHHNMPSLATTPC